MKKTILFISMFLSMTVSADCDSCIAGYHTTATYYDVPSHGIKLGELYLKYKVVGGEIQVDFTGLADYRNTVKPEALIYKIQKCKLSDVFTELSIGKKKNVALKGTSCFDQATQAEIPQTGHVFYNLQDKTLTFPEHVVQVKTAPLGKNFDLPSLENKIRNFVSRKYFRVTEGMLVKPDEYTKMTFEHSYFSNSELVQTVMTVVFSKKNDNRRYSAQIVFLSLKGEVWYVADSSYIGFDSSPTFTPAIEGQTLNDSIMKLGRVGLVTEGWVYGDSEFPQIIKFSYPDAATYIVDFGKSLKVFGLNSRTIGEIELSIFTEKTMGLVDEEKERPIRKKNEI